MSGVMRAHGLFVALHAPDEATAIDVAGRSGGKPQLSANALRIRAAIALRSFLAS